MHYFMRKSLSKNQSSTNKHHYYLPDEDQKINQSNHILYHQQQQKPKQNIQQPHEQILINNYTQNAKIKIDIVFQNISKNNNFQQQEVVKINKNKNTSKIYQNTQINKDNNSKMIINDDKGQNTPIKQSKYVYGHGYNKLVNTGANINKNKAAQNITINKTAIKPFNKFCYDNEYVQQIQNNRQNSIDNKDKRNKRYYNTQINYPISKNNQINYNFQTNTIRKSSQNNNKQQIKINDKLNNTPFPINTKNNNINNNNKQFILGQGRININDRFNNQQKSHSLYYQPKQKSFYKVSQFNDKNKISQFSYGNQINEYKLNTNNQPQTDQPKQQLRQIIIKQDNIQDRVQRQIQFNVRQQISEDFNKQKHGQSNRDNEIYDQQQIKNIQSQIQSQIGEQIQHNNISNNNKNKMNRKKSGVQIQQLIIPNYLKNEKQVMVQNKQYKQNNKNKNKNNNVEDVKKVDNIYQQQQLNELIRPDYKYNNEQQDIQYDQIDNRQQQIQSNKSNNNKNIQQINNKQIQSKQNNKQNNNQNNKQNNKQIKQQKQQQNKYIDQQVQQQQFLYQQKQINNNQFYLRGQGKWNNNNNQKWNNNNNQLNYINQQLIISQQQQLYQHNNSSNNHYQQHQHQQSQQQSHNQLDQLSQIQHHQLSPNQTYSPKHSSYSHKHSSYSPKHSLQTPSNYIPLNLKNKSLTIQINQSIQSHQNISKSNNKSPISFKYQSVLSYNITPSPKQPNNKQSPNYLHNQLYQQNIHQHNNQNNQSDLAQISLTLTPSKQKSHCKSPKRTYQQLEKYKLLFKKQYKNTQSTSNTHKKCKTKYIDLNKYSQQFNLKKIQLNQSSYKLCHHHQNHCFSSTQPTSFKLQDYSRNNSPSPQLQKSSSKDNHQSLFIRQQKSIENKQCTKPKVVRVNLKDKTAQDLFTKHKNQFLNKLKYKQKQGRKLNFKQSQNLSKSKQKRIQTKLNIKKTQASSTYPINRPLSPYIQNLSRRLSSPSSHSSICQHYKHYSRRDLKNKFISLIQRDDNSFLKQYYLSQDQLNQIFVDEILAKDINQIYWIQVVKQCGQRKLNNLRLRSKSKYHPYQSKVIRQQQVINDTNRTYAGTNSRIKFLMDKHLQHS